MKILVTGATGFIGGYILRYLRDNIPGAELIGTGRNRQKADQLSAQGFNILRGDISDPVFVRSSFKDISHVVHCAARASMWGKYDEFYRDNVLTTRLLLTELPELKRFVFISSANIYFDRKDRFDVKEDDPLPKRYLSNYPLTKLEAEREVQKAKKEIHRVILRPRGVIGPGDTTAFPRIISAFKENRIRMLGSGKNVVDLTSVKNLAYASMLALNSGDHSNGQAYNITDASTHAFWPLLIKTVKDLGYEVSVPRMNYHVVNAFAMLAEFIARIRNNGEPAIDRYGVALLKTSFTLNIEKAVRQLGYKPLITTEECIQEFLDWVKETKILSDQ